ncbi:MAG: hypothetical protein Q8K17_01380, partial [Pseudohongiella sp.]|nr:hypothetical protein [Pseudohongiella sp.]
IHCWLHRLEKRFLSTSSMNIQMFMATDTNTKSQIMFDISLLGDSHSQGWRRIPNQSRLT